MGELGTKTRSWNAGRCDVGVMPPRATRYALRRGLLLGKLNSAVQLFWEFQSVAEIAALLQSQLSRGRAFVSGAHGLAERDPCELVLVHPRSGEWMPLRAEVVHVSEEEPVGVGVELLDHGVDQVTALGRFVAGPPLEIPLERNSDSEADSRSSFELVPVEVPEIEEPEGGASSSPSSRPPASSSDFALNVNQRVRQLNPRERERLARKGNLSERKALERAFGSPLWEALLANPQLTSPEVARIARNGTVTQPILRVIVANNTWIQKAEVRRALLSNPRLTGPHIDRVLRTVPRLELQKIPMQTAYPAQVRMAAAKLLPPR